MYEVGAWFTWLLNGAVLAIVGLAVLIYVIRQKEHYRKEAETKIQAEIQLSTGFSEFHTVPCGISDKSVTIGGFEYFLNPNEIRWGMHPRNPVLGLRALQTPIRKESWAKDNANPIRPKYDKHLLTAAEMKALNNEVLAADLAMRIQESEARDKEMTRAMTNQPNKTYVYAGLAAIGVGIVVMVIILVQAVYL